MKKLVLILLAVGLILCVGCGQKKEEEVNLPQQKPAVGQEVPVAPDLHKEDKKELTQKQKELNKKIYGNEEGGKYKPSAEFHVGTPKIN